MPPDHPRRLAPAARAKNAFGILFSPPNRKNAARSLNSCCMMMSFMQEEEVYNGSEMFAHRYMILGSISAASWGERGLIFPNSGW